MSQFNLIEHQTILQCIEISKTYLTPSSTTKVLENFSLTLCKGEIGMLMGPSGCGKTTLLMIAGGVLIPDSGSCAVQGKDLFMMDVNQKIAFRAAHISFLFQQLHLFPSLSVLDNVALPLLIDGVSPEQAHHQAKELLVRMELQSCINARLETLSGGEKQRVALARALIKEASIILCDEPTSNLDTDSALLAFTLINEYAKNRGCTFLISTHDERIIDYADQIYRFNGLNDYQLCIKDVCI
ncbi:ABC transporter ATP-binding protein [Legionella pneumophila]|uniref:ABC transporter ATP-binding protein n=1 Tax=Legionella pneumophila TaxID=446 RepID=UPI00077889CE|nr:ABC transporter ATP-binding protein [Legionella pneumophila]HAT8606388.1 ATP-binding cassette domain-containing protein [Legionella pneumophila]